MANFGAGYGAPVGGAFGGFPGGYNQSPGGIMPGGFVDPNMGFGAVPTIGTNLPSVDPNTFAGTVHFGPATSYAGQYPGQFLPGAGGINPNFGGSGY